MGLGALALAAPVAAAEQRGRVVIGLPEVEEFVVGGAYGLLVPGAGSTVTREGALEALLQGRLEHALLGGTPDGEHRIEIGGPEREFTIYVELPPPGEHPNDRRYSILIRGPGWRGVLESASTRIPGLVSIVDIAPTALGEPGGLRVRDTGEAPVQFLGEIYPALDERISDNDRARLPASLALAVIVALFVLFRPGAAPAAFVGGLAANLLLGVTAAALPADLAYAFAFLAPPAVSIPVVAIGAAAAPLLARRLAGAVGVVLAAYLVAMALDPAIVALSPLGPSQLGRFYGFSNLLETVWLAPLFATVALLAGRRPWHAAALALLALIVVAGNRFGADGGGAVVLLVGFIVLALRLGGRALTPRRLALAFGGAIVLAAALVGLDAATGGSSHVTEAFGSGPASLAGDIGDRIHLSVLRAISWWGSLAIVLAGVAVLVFYGLRQPRFPASDAAVAAVAVSLVLNDTPSDVAGFGALACATLWSWERHRVG